jgi:hypothetical protein
MFERGKNMPPATGIIYQNHQSNGGSPENIQRIIALVHGRYLSAEGNKENKIYPSEFNLAYLQNE